jgi:phosphoenolpyruvate synthase/pyruvate phosphate dikinase
MSNLAMSYGSAAVKGSWNVDETQEEGLQKLTGYGASQGIALGPCTVVSKLEDLDKVRRGTILVCETASPKLAHIMARLSGLVTEKGGSLSIAAGYAREYETPAVVGVKGILEVVRNGDVLRVDGSKGTVEVIS